MPTQDLAQQQRLKIRRTTLGFGVIQVILGLALTGLSFASFGLSEADRIRNACPYWAGFTVFCSGGVGIVAWRHSTILSMGLFTFFSAVCVVLHMIGTILTGEVGGLLKSVIECQFSDVDFSCMCCDSIMTCKQNVPTYKFEGVEDCTIVTGLLKELMYGLCVLNIFGSVVCFIATILGCTSVARQAGRDQPLFRRRLSTRSESHEQTQYSWLPYPTDLNMLPPYAPPVYRSVDNFQDFGATPYIVPPPVFDPTDLPPPYRSRDASMTGSGVSLTTHSERHNSFRSDYSSGNSRHDDGGAAGCLVADSSCTAYENVYHQRMNEERGGNPSGNSSVTSVVVTEEGVRELYHSNPTPDSTATHMNSTSSTIGQVTRDESTSTTSLQFSRSQTSCSHSQDIKAVPQTDCPSICNSPINSNSIPRIKPRTKCETLSTEGYENGSQAASLQDGLVICNADREDSTNNIQERDKSKYSPLLDTHLSEERENRDIIPSNIENLATEHCSNSNVAESTGSIYCLVGSESVNSFFSCETSGDFEIPNGSPINSETLSEVDGCQLVDDSTVVAKACGEATGRSESYVDSQVVNNNESITETETLEDISISGRGHVDGQKSTLEQGAVRRKELTSSRVCPVSQLSGKQSFDVRSQVTDEVSVHKDENANCAITSSVELENRERLKADGSCLKQVSTNTSLNDIGKKEDAGGNSKVVIADNCSLIKYDGTVRINPDMREFPTLFGKLNATASGIKVIEKSDYAKGTRSSLGNLEKRNGASHAVQLAHVKDEQKRHAHGSNHSGRTNCNLNLYLTSLTVPPPNRELPLEIREVGYSFLDNSRPGKTKDARKKDKFSKGKEPHLVKSRGAKLPQRSRDVNNHGIQQTDGSRTGERERKGVCQRADKKERNSHRPLASQRSLTKSFQKGTKAASLRNSHGNQKRSKSAQSALVTPKHHTPLRPCSVTEEPLWCRANHQHFVIEPSNATLPHQAGRGNETVV